MTDLQLLQLIQNGEGESVEFKAQGKLLVNTVGKIVTAFLNSKGGYLIVGVKDVGNIVGVEEEQIMRLKDFTIGLVLRKIKPTANVKFSTIDISGKKVVVIEVPEGNHKPYGYSVSIRRTTGLQQSEMRLSCRV
jgi:ATP-dependent DNA helicase RecG